MTKEERKPCIYKATSKTTGLSYIGQSKLGINRRKKQHISGAFRKNFQTLFCTALRDFGLEDFEWSILETVDPSLSPEMIQEQLNFLEKHYVKVYDSYNNGYNMNSGGSGELKYKYATLEAKEEARRKRKNAKRAANREKVNARQNAKRALKREKINARQNAKRAANREAWREAFNERRRKRKESLKKKIRKESLKKKIRKESLKKKKRKQKE